MLIAIIMEIPQLFQVQGLFIECKTFAAMFSFIIKDLINLIQQLYCKTKIL